ETWHPHRAAAQRSAAGPQPGLREPPPRRQPAAGQLPCHNCTGVLFTQSRCKVRCKMPRQQVEAPAVIHVNAVYTARQLVAALGLRQSTIRREVKAGRLRVSKRAGRYFFLGQFVLEWLQSGEIERKDPAPEG